MAKILKTQVILISLGLTLVSAVLSGCIQRKKSPKNGAEFESDYRIAYFTANPFAGNSRLSEALAPSLANVKQDKQLFVGFDEEFLMATAACRCTPRFAGGYQTSLMQTRGTLPQILVPSIRQEIWSQPLLKTLLAITPGNTIGSSIAGLFLKDSKINSEVRKGLSDKLRASLPGGSDAIAQHTLQLDLFQNPVQNLGNRDALAPKTMMIGSQAAKWIHIFGTDNLWENSTPVRAPDHGVQMFATAASLLEWSYLYGLDKDQRQQALGGLTFDPRLGPNSAIGAFDPRVQAEGTGIVSGTYSVSFPEKSAIDSAINARELWKRAPSAITLDEQARVWLAAAMAFERLKPSQRRMTQMFKSAGGMLPDEAHQLPLAFLPGMATLLDGGFVDTNALSINEVAYLQAVSTVSTERTAKLTSLAKMMRAMTLWSTTLDSIQNEKVEAATAQKLAQNQTKIKDVLRLSVQAVLDNHVQTRLTQSRLRGIGIVDSVTTQARPNLDVAAEVLIALTLAELRVFKGTQQGTDFSKKIIGLHHWFAAEYLVDLIERPTQTQLKPQSALLIQGLLSLAKQLPAQELRAPWLDDALNQVQRATSDWDGRIGS